MNRKEISMKDNKYKKDIDKVLLITLLVIVILQVFMLITLIAIGVRKIVPLMLLIIPTIFAVVALLFLSRNSLIHSRREKKKPVIKVNI